MEKEQRYPATCSLSRPRLETGQATDWPRSRSERRSEELNTIPILLKSDSSAMESYNITLLTL
jgi:hypothetical protein